MIYEDVVFVIYLYEETITTLFGPSLMSPPQAVLGGVSIDPHSFSIAQEVIVLFYPITLSLIAINAKLSKLKNMAEAECQLLVY